MGIEYVVHFNEKQDECFATIVQRLQGRFPDARVGVGDSFYLPSATPGWEDFGIEKTDGGIFILTTFMSGPMHTDLFRILEGVLGEMGIDYEIEEL